MKQLITERMFDVTRDKRCRSYAIAFWISSGNSITSAPAGPSHPFPPLPPPQGPRGLAACRLQPRRPRSVPDSDSLTHSRSLFDEGLAAKRNKAWKQKGNTGNNHLDRHLKRYSHLNGEQGLTI